MLPKEEKTTDMLITPAVSPNGNGEFVLCLELLTEEELVIFLRIPHVSNSKNYHNVIENLKRVRGLPRIHICRKALYPKRAVLQWVERQISAGK